MFGIVGHRDDVNTLGNVTGSVSCDGGTCDGGTGSASQLTRCDGAAWSVPRFASHANRDTDPVPPSHDTDPVSPSWQDSNRPNVLVFGGTSEGRQVAEWLGDRGACCVLYSALTEYGGSLLEGVANVHCLTGRMLPEHMEELMRAQVPICVIDATHPYAAGISASIAKTAQITGTKLFRVLREGEPDGPWVGVASAREAAEYLVGTSGTVLLTTGSKDLPIYAQVVPDFTERCYVRILPVESSLAAAAELGIPASHVVAMQGPFSQQFNEALMRELNVQVMVTKASGAAGGFWEKVEAARACDVQVVVIHRPVDEEGMSMQNLYGILEGELGL